mgnify:CR=1 FL=1
MASRAPGVQHTLGVDWDTSFARAIKPVKAWATTTVSKLSAALYRGILGASVPVITKTVEPERIYLKLEEALGRRGQAVLYGPPGTGKTYRGSSSGRLTARRR